MYGCDLNICSDTNMNALNTSCLRCPILGRRTRVRSFVRDVVSWRQQMCYTQVLRHTEGRTLRWHYKPLSVFVCVRYVFHSAGIFPDPSYQSRVQYLGKPGSKNCSLMISDLKQSDSGTYIFYLITSHPTEKMPAQSGVQLLVAGLYWFIDHLICFKVFYFLSSTKCICIFIGCVCVFYSLMSSKLVFLCL